MEGAIRPRSDRYRVRPVRLHELDRETISAWARLEERALEGNAYLSPHFVIPAVRRLLGAEDASKLLFLFVERGGGIAGGLSGAGVFRRSAGNRRVPFPHLEAFLSPHSYLSGLLIDREDAAETARALFRFFCDGGASWHGVAFRRRVSEGEQARLLAGVAEEFGASWHVSESTLRPVFVPGSGGEEYLRERVSRHRAKMIRQLRRRLEERGEVRWIASFGGDVRREAVDRFLELEHMGWKGERGTSLRSDPRHEAFFREMAGAFGAEGRLFLTELSLDGRVIASTANLIAGGAGFAFKIGWDPEYSRLSPGVLNEVEFIRRAPRLCGGLSYIDSGAEDGSFIDSLWTERRRLVSGAFATSAAGRRLLRGVELARGVKRWCGTLIGAADAGGSRN